MDTTKTQATFTRGPWRVVDRPSRGVQIEWGGPDDGEERPIAHMRWTDGLRPIVEARVAADACLIAAAPDLLAALKMTASLDDSIDAFAGNEDIRSAVRAAVAKAEGR